MIYFQTTTAFNNVHELLDSFYQYGDDQEDDGNYSLQAVTTYDDPECSIEQCDDYRTRSFDDMEVLINTYFPELTTKEIVHELVTFRKVVGSHTYSFRWGHCSDIRLITLWYHRNEKNFEYHEEFEDCYQYDSKYSWEGLMDLIGVESKKDLKKYQEKFWEVDQVKELVAV